MSHQRKSPESANEQDAPEPERMITPAEEAGMDLAELENPPQAEGPRDDEEDGGGESSRDRRRNEGAD